MKSRFRLFLVAAVLPALFACAPGIVQKPTTVPPPSPAGSALHGVFEGITACSAQARPLPQIPADASCELMTWKIILYQDSASGTPTTYVLKSAYGVSQANTTSPAEGGAPITMEGNWAIVTGTKTDPEAEVVQLYSENSEVAVSFVKIDEDLLHVLNRDGTLMPGNAAWSYTLNRTDNRPPFAMDEPVSSGPEATRPPIPARPPGSAVLGVFEGRVPCHEAAFDMLDLAPFAGCLKLKSRLTLYVDQETGAPNSYTVMGTSTIREGIWTILEGTEADPDAVVYQLHLEGAKGPVSFLKADQNHLFLLDRDLNVLVGTPLFSYTLSRIEKP